MRSFKQFLESECNSDIIESCIPIFDNPNFNPNEFFNELFDLMLESSTNTKQKYDIMILKENVILEADEINYGKQNQDSAIDYSQPTQQTQNTNNWMGPPNPRQAGYAIGQLKGAIAPQGVGSAIGNALGKVGNFFSNIKKAYQTTRGQVSGQVMQQVFNSPEFKSLFASQDFRDKFSQFITQQLQQLKQPQKPQQQQSQQPPLLPQNQGQVYSQYNSPPNPPPLPSQVQGTGQYTTGGVQGFGGGGQSFGG